MNSKWEMPFVITCFIIMGIVMFGVYKSETEVTTQKETELASKINNAYSEGYDIFVEGTKVGQIPNEVLENYKKYDILFDDLGKTVVITRTPEYHFHRGGNVTPIIR